MKTQKTTRKMKTAVFSGLPALTLAGMIAICTFALPAVVFSQTTEWTTYNVSNSQLPFDRIGPLVFDAQGNLWIASGDLSPGSSAGGLAKFGGENWTVYYTSNSGLPCNNIHALAFDGQGNLWIGTGVPLNPSRGGLAKFDGENWTVYNRGNSGLPYNIVWDLAFDALRNLWIGTVEPVCGSEAGGLAKFDGQNWTVYNKVNSGLTSNDVWDLLFDAQGNLWVGHGDDYLPAGGGLAKFDGENWTVYHTSNSPLTWHMVTSLALDAQQNLWMGMCSAHTTTGGVARFDGEDWWVFNEWNSGLPHITATGLAFDEQGSAWIGTYGGGLAVCCPRSVVDFNGDGFIDTKDLLRLIESWGQDAPMADIAPPFGDGVVDALDLELLMSYWEQPVDDPTLIAHWALDESEGAIASDSKGTSDGYVFGDAVWEPDGGQVGGAISLDGIDDHIVAGLALNPADGPFSVFAWVQGGMPGQTVISQFNGDNWLGADSASGCLTTELCSSGRGGAPLQSAANITDGSWHRVGLVWDGVYRVIYVDDIPVAEDTQTGLESSVGGLRIGCGIDPAVGTFWSGLIDDVRVHGRAVRP